MQDTVAGITIYIIDIANRLTSVEGAIYIWDDKGNLLSDAVSTYSYNHANRLSSSFNFAFNGRENRLTAAST